MKYQTRTNQPTKRVTEVEMEVSEDTKTEKVPPVILINPGSLNNAICRKLQNKKMQYLKANMIREGVAITRVYRPRLQEPDQIFE